jgi:hypothetical protein
MSSTCEITSSGGMSVFVASYALVKLADITKEQTSISKSFVLPNCLAFD